MAHLLFVMHGMGRHVPDWAETTVDLLHGLPAMYDYAWFEQNGSLDEHVEIVPIAYDAVFDHHLQEWGANSRALREKAAEFGVDISGALGWLERASATEQNFFWTHVVDVLLYRFFSIVTAEVRLRVRLQITEVLEARMRGGAIVSASVLAHSLGTSVAHDSLALLGSQPVQTDLGPNSAWMVRNHRFANVFMCANVSRVLETQPKVYESVMRPPGGGAESYVDAYYNFRHELDPFPMVRQFAPVGWSPTRFVAAEESEKVLQFNVHGLEHYLEDPRVHIPILRATIGHWVVSPQEEAAAVRDYLAMEEPRCVAELLRFKAEAERIISLARAGADPLALIIAGTQFLAAAREAADAC